MTTEIPPEARAAAREYIEARTLRRKLNYEYEASRRIAWRAFNLLQEACEVAGVEYASLLRQVEAEQASHAEAEKEGRDD